MIVFENIQITSLCIALAFSFKIFIISTKNDAYCAVEFLSCSCVQVGFNGDGMLQAVDVTMYANDGYISVSYTHLTLPTNREV